MYCNIFGWWLNNFTLEAWFKTNNSHEINLEGENSGFPKCTSCQKYLFWPNYDGMDGDEN